MEVSQDISRLTEYAFEAILHAAANAGASASAPPQIPAPHLRWLEHLGRIERALALSPAFVGRLCADTARGLAALETARERFRRSYKQCPGCARFIFRAARRCPCGEKF